MVEVLIVLIGLNFRVPGTRLAPTTRSLFAEHKSSPKYDIGVIDRDMITVIGGSQFFENEMRLTSMYDK